MQPTQRPVTGYNQSQDNQNNGQHTGGESIGKHPLPARVASQAQCNKKTDKRENYRNHTRSIVVNQYSHCWTGFGTLGWEDANENEAKTDKNQKSDANLRTSPSNDGKIEPYRKDYQ